jgi:hypothetical protein
MFQKQPINIIKDFYLRRPLENSFNWDLDFFDREGYQLNSIEKEYHLKNQIDIFTQDRIARRVSGNALNAVMQHWYIQKHKHPNIFIDHAHILHRFAFSGDALTQLIEMSAQYPKLQKMINIKPKYGLDFAIDWIDKSQIIEIFHIELDCRDYHVFVDVVEKLQNFIEHVDWESKASELILHKLEWIDLNEYEQSIYKAKLYGLDKLELDYFTDHYLNKPYLFSYLKVIE